jgi:glutathione S-transferase
LHFLGAPAGAQLDCFASLAMTMEFTLILIGQYDSPFVRRVGVALRLYGFAFEHRPWSTFSEGDKIAPFNPLRRVPTLVLDNGETLIESTVILDYLDELAGAKAMMADSGDARRRQLKVCALATGLGDKAVALFYERVLHKETSQVWTERCRTQISGVLDVLETARGSVTTPWWFGGNIGHADVAVACALRFVRDAHPGVFDEGRYPALTRHAAACEAMPVFKEIAQEFIPPS